jgi:group I intron endonuclease
VAITLVGPCAGHIYKIVNRVNGKVYVGQTITLAKRFEHHKTMLRAQKHANKKLQNSWNKHGESNFEFSPILSVLDVSDLTSFEQFFADTFRSVGVELYNVGKFMDSPMRGLKGELNPRWGAHHSEETKRKIGDAQRGEKSPNFGKKASEQTRKKLSDAHSRRLPASSETRRKISEAKTGVPRLNLRVPVIDGLGNRFDSIQAAATFHQIEPCHVSRYLAGRTLVNPARRFKYATKDTE